MRTLVKTAALGLGLLTSGTAMADNNFGGSPLYNPQYSYYGPSYYYGGYPNYLNYNTGYPNYYSYYHPGYNYTYGAPYYGSYPTTNYPYWNDPTMPSHPYSRNNPNWIPYVGWR